MYAFDYVLTEKQNNKEVFEISVPIYLPRPIDPSLVKPALFRDQRHLFRLRYDWGGEDTYDVRGFVSQFDGGGGDLRAGN